MINKLRKRGLKAILLGSAIAMPVHSGFAQDAEADKVQEDRSGVIETVVVTATKRETNLMDTPLAISAFNEAALDKLGIQNIKDLNNIVPNMSLMVDVESNAPIVTMRGVRSTNTTEWGDPAVGIHIDGIYSPRPQGALALMFDIDRAEVMRGPQGTLFGRNSTVGSMNIISKRPDFDGVSGKAQMEYGRWNFFSAKGAVNVPLSDTFAIRVAAIKTKQDSNIDGFWDPNQWDQRYLREMGVPFIETDAAPGPATNSPDNRFYFRDTLYEPVPVTDKRNFYNNVNNYAARITALWKPSDKLSWLFTAERFRDDSAGGLNTRDCGRISDRDISENGGSCTDIWGNENNFEAYVNIPGINDMTQDSFRTRFEYDLYDDIQFVYVGGFTSQERKGQIDLDQGYYLWDQMLKWVDTDYDNWNHEIQLKSTGEGKLQWILGAFNFSEDNYLNGQYHGAMGGVALWLQPERTINSNAVFAQGTYELNEKLFLTVGGRYTSDTKEDRGGRNYSCWGGDCHPEAWAMVPWGAIDWGNFGNYDAQSDEFKESTTVARAMLNALPSNYFDNPNDDFTIDTNNDVKNSWSKFTWRVGLDYDVTEDIMIYGYAANGYKAGGNGDVLRLQSDPSVLFDTSYNPETVLTYEAGIKAKTLNGKMNLRANAFYSDYNDYQLTQMTTYDVITVEAETPEGTIMVEEELQTFLTRNAAKSRIMGLEFEMEWNAWENGNISG